MAWNWPFARRTSGVGTAEDILAASRGQRGGRMASNVTRSNALKHSAIWAGLRLRADLVSTMPIDTFRKLSDGTQIEVAKPPVLINPGGSEIDLTEWMYSSQFDLDSCGNTFGIISARDGLGFPAQIDLVPYTDVTVRVRNNVVSYLIAGTSYEKSQIWHERQFTMSGIPVGLSPIAYAAFSINGYLSAQQFALDWFSNSAVPASMLKNQEKVLAPGVADKVKERFRASVENGDVFVTGKDWDYQMLAAKASDAQFIEEREFGLVDACRFIGVPADMIDASSSGSSVTYANITQRNLQLLIMNIGPSITRRERALSNLMPRPRFVKLNTEAILRMDTKSRYEGYSIAIDKRWMAPSEVRIKENLPPMTPEQEAEIGRLFPAKTPAPITGAPAA